MVIQCRQKNPDNFTSEARILDIQRDERAALTERTERLCAVTKARNYAVLKRLGLSVQDFTQPSPQPPAFPRKSIKPSRREKRISCILDAPCLNMEDIDRNQKSPKGMDDEDDDCFRDTVLPGGQMTALLRKEAQTADRDESLTASISLSSVDTLTPNELRAISLIGSPVELTTFKPIHAPQAVLLSRRRASRLPVFSAKLSGADKEVTDGCRLQTAKYKVEAIVTRLERFQLNSVPPARPQATAKRNPEVAPTLPRVRQTTTRGSRPGMFLPRAKVSGEGKKTASVCSIQTPNDRKVELQPLTNPVESLSLCFRLLSSDDWVKKIDGLKTMQALAQHHSETLKTKLHEVCLVLIEEVKNLRSTVSCAAMNTLAELYVQLQKAMDPEAEGTGRALLLKLAQTRNAFIQQQANLALDAMVQSCSHGRIVNALLNTGLSHRCVALRGSMAQHLHLLADGLGAARILTAGRSFTERFLTAVSKISVDAAPEVRHHGKVILQELALHKDFLSLWTKIIPEKERRSLDKILKKAKK
ncbi:crescerin-like protein che-12 isoform X1 [Micropterus dolomieu]|uniref:crescerin-like protein che-12 isoform X1 n=1 Tax=Micropterus dolomieu TaxID=147949 RepID=UPI001E8E79CE|nr:crescerin-like protein che-12 isoform X1 [Micropterus dolomieu]